MLTDNFLLISNKALVTHRNHTIFNIEEQLERVKMNANLDNYKI